MFHCTRVKERVLNIRTMEVLACISVVGKIYAGTLVDIVCRVTGGSLTMSKGTLEQEEGV